MSHVTSLYYKLKKQNIYVQASSNYQIKDFPNSKKNILNYRQK